MTTGVVHGPGERSQPLQHRDGELQSGVSHTTIGGTGTYRLTGSHQGRSLPRPPTRGRIRTLRAGARRHRLGVLLLPRAANSSPTVKKPSSKTSSVGTNEEPTAEPEQQRWTGSTRVCFDMPHTSAAILFFFRGVAPAKFGGAEFSGGVAVGHPPPARRATTGNPEEWARGSKRGANQT